MSQRDVAHLVDVLVAARLLRRFIEGVEKAAFEADELRQAAVIRQLEVIGEATKRFSPAFRSAHPHIPWRQMAGMRDILIHAYDHVDLDEVWNVATRELPSLMEKISALLPPGTQTERE